MRRPKFSYSQRLLSLLSLFKNLAIDLRPIPFNRGCRLDTALLSLALAIDGFKVDCSDLVNPNRFLNKPKISRLTTSYQQVIDLILAQNRPKPTSQAKLLDVEKTIKKINQILSNNASYTMNNNGYRISKIVVEDELNGIVVYQPPSAFRLPFLMSDVFKVSIDNQMNLGLRAAFLYYAILFCRPFGQANQMTALFATWWLLLSESKNHKLLVNLGRNLTDMDLQAYNAFFKTTQSAKDIWRQDLTFWFEFFLQAMIVGSGKPDKTSVPATVQSKASPPQLISRRIKTKPTATTKRPTPVKPRSKPTETTAFLTDRQIKLLRLFQKTNMIKMAYAKFIFPNLSDDTLLRELQRLQRYGIIIRKGRTKGSYYVLVDKFKDIIYEI